MPELQRFQADNDIDTIYEGLLQDGGVIVDDLLNKTLLGQLNSEVDPLLAAADPAHKHLNPALDFFFGDKTRHVTGLAGKSPNFAENVMLHPVYQGLCERVLLPNCADYILNLAHIMDRGGGAQRQIFHRDEDIWVHMPTERPELQLASIVAMVDFTRDNGATAVVPGSHRWPRGRKPQEDELAYAEMPAGSAVIYLGSTVHAGGTNTLADFWRRGIHMSFCLGWLRTEENNLLATPPEMALNLSVRAQQLLGYGVHDAIDDLGGYLGMVDMRDPGVLLREGSLI
jgi:ectoine hydroxylase-related dioxygenase (phytanoyl-CoA dioxygenase family)